MSFLVYSVILRRQVHPVFHTESQSQVTRVLIGFPVYNFSVLYDKLDHVVMATELIDKMLPSETRHKVRSQLKQL